MRRTGLVIGCVLVGLVVIAGVVSAVWTPHDPNLVVPAEPVSYTHLTLPTID